MAATSDAKMVAECAVLELAPNLIKQAVRELEIKVAKDMAQAMQSIRGESVGDMKTQAKFVKR